MAHFAKIENNVVTQVIVISNDDILDSNGNEQESIGIDFINNTLGLDGIWKQTSYNKNIRKNFAGIGSNYDEINDVFYDEKPGNNYTLDTTEWVWKLNP